ncbi:MAG: YfcE family phosphodiesterase [Frankiales bacterium]|nr:YfcE family phosphodiesterase [Frankiales bacterium]
MRLLLLADTHGRPLPDEVWASVDSADLVVHAGDFVTADLLDELEARADVLACWGNNDGADLRARLPEVARRTVAGVRLAVVHETGAASGRGARMDRRYDEDVLVFGHSHVPWDTVTPRGMRLLNPGSATTRRRQPHCTFMTLDLPSGEVVLHRLGA